MEGKEGGERGIWEGEKESERLKGMRKVKKVREGKEDGGRRRRKG